MDRFVNAVGKFTNKTAAAEWLLVVMAGVLVFELIMRLVFNSPTIWAHEGSGYIFGAVVILAGAYTLKMGGHVSVNIFTARMAQQSQKRLKLMGSTIIVVVTIVILSRAVPYAVKAALSRETSGTYWNPVLYPIDWIMVIGYILLGLEAVRSTFIDARELRK